MFEELMINVRKAVTSIIRLLQVYSAISDKFKITTRLIFNKTKDREIKNTLFGVTLCIIALSAPIMAPAETGSFTVHFTGCTEFAGWGPVALAQAQPLVPAGYVLAGAAFTGHGGKIKQSTSFSVISFGTAAVTLYTSNTSLLGNLIGGNTASNFSFLSVRGVYPTATMTVSFKGSEGR
jgi:hypothetical protein